VLRGAFKNTGEIHMFVLLGVVNAYDQYGCYFCGVFSTKEKAREQISHEGRENSEDFWYEIEEVTLNTKVEMDW
jgi:hypothetical protein